MIRVAELEFYREDEAVVTWSIKVEGSREWWLMSMDLGNSASLISFGESGLV